MTWKNIGCVLIVFDLYVLNFFDLKILVETLIGDENVSLDSIIVDWASLIKVLIKKTGNIK